MKIFAVLLTLGLFGLLAWSIFDTRTINNKLDLLISQQHPASVEKHDEQVAKLEQEILAQQPTPAPAPSNPVADLAVAPATTLPSPQPITPAVEAPSPVVAANQPAAVMDNNDITFPGATTNSGPISTQDVAAPALTPLQQRTLSAPAISEITEYHQQYGFVLIRAHALAQPGTTFSVRRGHSIIAKIVVSSVDEGIICDIVPGSIAAGVTLQPGDSIIENLSTPTAQP